MEVSKALVGTWRLVSFEIRPKDGPRRPWRPEAHGLLLYAPTGHMSVSINSSTHGVSEEDFEGIFDSILFYAGTYLVEGDTIRHQVTEASNPARIGREMLRHVELKDDVMTLTTPEESFGRAALVWKKVEP